MENEDYDDLSPNRNMINGKGFLIEIFENSLLDRLNRFLPGFFIKKTKKIDSTNIIKMNYWGIEVDAIDFSKRKSTFMLNEKGRFEKEVVEIPGENYITSVHNASDIYIIGENKPTWLKETSIHNTEIYDIRNNIDPFELEEELYFLAKKQASGMCKGSLSEIVDKTHFVL